MVWWLDAADSAGPGPFYFTAPGTYLVGRKDCTIIIQTDKSISRLHAEISVEAAPRLGSDDKDYDNLPRCRVLLKDFSKFGTFVNKEAGSKPLNSLPKNVTDLKEGDIITFGTNKAVFRLRYLPMVLCMSPSTLQSITELRSKVEAAGAYVFEQWNCQCTHLLVEESSPVTNLVMAAVLSKKHVLSLEWLQALMSQSSPRDQLPSLSRYIPTLTMVSRGLSLPTPIAEPLVRGETLAGYTVFIQKGCLYHNHDLPTLVNTAGGSVKLFTQDNLKDAAGSVQQHGLLVFPAEQTSRKDWLGSKVLPSIQHLDPISEEYLLRSILTAKLDMSNFTLSPASSVDTDETVEEEDTDIEDDSTSSVPQENVQIADLRLPLPGPAFADNTKDNAVVHQPSTILQTTPVWQSQPTESRKYFEKASLPASILVDSPIKHPVKFPAVIQTVNKQPIRWAGAEHSLKEIIKSEADSVVGGGGGGGDAMAEVIYTNGLMVRKNWSGSPVEAWHGAVPNFKCFKKGVAEYGNSFSSLVPFAKDPYRESDYGREMGEYLKQEKKRKEAELLADDLFNAEQLKRRRVTAAKEGGASVSRSKKLA